MFITFEGGEGSGKSTIIEAIRAHFSASFSVLVSREPGGSVIAEAIRDVVLNPKHQGMEYSTEALLYAAARAQHLSEVLIPAFTKYDLVLCDRYVDSSLAYQAYARELGFSYVEHINDDAMKHLPNMTFYIDVSPEVGLARIKDRDKQDRLDLETLSFHHKVREGYLEVVKRYPKRVILIDGHRPLDVIIQEMIHMIEAKH
jgi:dTMP kinase